MAANGKWLKALANGTALQSGVGTTLGIALNGASLDQPLTVQTAGQYTVGATVALGTVYLVSETAGSLCLLSDVSTTNDWFTWAIFPVSTTVAIIGPIASNTQHA